MVGPFRFLSTVDCKSSIPPYMVWCHGLTCPSSSRDLLLTSAPGAFWKVSEAAVVLSGPLMGWGRDLVKGEVECSIASASKVLPVVCVWVNTCVPW